MNSQDNDSVNKNYKDRYENDSETTNHTTRS